MMQDLRDTRQYFFRGFSGRHAAARLLLSHSEWELRAVIADPRETRDQRAGPLPHSPRGRDADTIQAAGCTRRSRIGLVGLYLARSRCTRMDVTVISDLPLDRVEIFDDSVWITLYSDGGAPALPAQPALLRGFVHLQHATRRVRPDQRAVGPPVPDHAGPTREDSSRCSSRSPKPP